MEDRANVPRRSAGPLPYPDAKFTATLRCATEQGRVLGQLRHLVEYLSTWFPWRPVQATTFVLTGAVPIAQVLDIIRLEDGRAQVSFDVDVAEAELLDAIRAARREFVGTSRVRQPEEKAVAMVVHWFENPDLADAERVDWARSMRSWNEHVKNANLATNWQYKSVPAYRQALIDGRARIGGEARRPGS